MKNVIRIIDTVATIVADDPWTLVASEDGLQQDQPAQHLILPLHLCQQWQAAQPPAEQNKSPYGIWLTPDCDERTLKPWLDKLAIIALQFPSFRDGRAYTQAHNLRKRLGWEGELRAIGDVLQDQLSLMRQCGFDSFAVREDKSVSSAANGLKGISVLYSSSVIEPRPLFKRR